MWRTTPPAYDDHFGGAAADVEQAAAKFALVLRQAGFGRGERLEHRVIDTHAGAIYRRDDILRGGTRGGDDVDVDFEALADHTDRVADVVLVIQEKFLREDVQDFAIFRQLHAAGGFDGPADVVALHVARARAYRDAAAAVYAADVRASDADQRRFHRHAYEGFGFFDGAGGWS